MALAVNCLSKKTASYHKCTNFILYLFSGVKKILFGKDFFSRMASFWKFLEYLFLRMVSFRKFYVFNPREKK